MCRFVQLLLLSVASAAWGAPPVQDPTQPFQAASAVAGGIAAPRYTLTAVIISPSRRIAIVNGRPHREGDRVDDAEIKRIDFQSVVLRRGEQEFLIHLDSQSSRGEPGR